ncbi:stAR-related lipid transfer protein 9 [Trichonephila clavata]|uniref:StAR-related lipid transfer protein 9 n=1 Tax=Trichonephila clavata TaxID=2740835 RepID=A0A8X6JV57_TRICU|nr:stAR-related lipid transfer protein 9 [Trichonephila clavata]
MEIIALDIFLLIISLIFALTLLTFYAFPLILLCFGHDCIEAIAVVDVIKTLKKVCPVDIGNKWRLLPVEAGVSRVWTKKIQFPGFQNNLALYSTACGIPCSSMYAFSLITDVTKWKEWEPSSQCLLLKPFYDDKLQRDSFMQANQVVGIQRGTNVQDYVAMYRFTSFEEKTVKWILFWNAKKMEFMFFLIQPAISKADNSQCVITHIFGSKFSSPHLALSIAQRMRNIKDFLLMSQIHIVASRYTSAAAERSHSNKLISKTEIDKPLHKVPVESDSSRIQYTFVLKPITYQLNCIYNRLKGFQLAIRETEVESTTIKQKKKDHVSKLAKESQGVLKRSTSEINIKPKRHLDFKSSLELNTISENRDSSIVGRSFSEPKKSSIIIEENLKIHSDDEKAKKLHSQSVPNSAKVAKGKSSSHSDCSETHTDEDIYVNLHIIHESIPQENSSPFEIGNRNDVFCSSTSDFELVDSNQQFLDCRLADFLTQGNYGASELQAEMMLASQFDNDDQTSEGGWMYHSTYKGITVLSKVTSGQFIKIVSYLCQVELPIAAQDIWKCVKNPRFRFIYDETVKTVKIIERISDSQKLIHVFHQTSGVIKKEGIDFCLLQTERLEANLYYSSFHSIEYEKCPLMTSVVRGSLRPSGWVVEKLGSQICKVTYMLQIIVSSPDSLYINELSSLVPLAMHNLKNYASARPK